MHAINDDQCPARDFSFLKRVSKFQSLEPPAKKYCGKYLLEGYKIFPKRFFLSFKKCEFKIRFR